MKVFMIANSSIQSDKKEKDNIKEMEKKGFVDGGDYWLKQFVNDREYEVTEDEFKAIKLSCITGKEMRDYKNKKMNMRHAVTK